MRIYIALILIWLNFKNNAWVCRILDKISVRKWCVCSFLRCKWRVASSNCNQIASFIFTNYTGLCSCRILVPLNRAIEQDFIWQKNRWKMIIALKEASCLSVHHYWQLRCLLAFGWLYLFFIIFWCFLYIRLWSCWWYSCSGNSNVNEFIDLFRMRAHSRCQLQSILSWLIAFEEAIFSKANVIDLRLVGQ